MNSDFAFIIHKRHYKDSSELIKLLTQNHGMVDVIAKGGRQKKSKLYGQLQPFLMTEVFYSGKSSLKTLIDASQQGTVKSCAYINQVSMLYCNELMTLLQIDNDACQSIFKAYQATVHQLQLDHAVSLPLRKFEWFLSKHVGYELNLPEEAKETDFVEFDANYGIQINNQNKVCMVNSLQNFISNKNINKDEIKQINQLMKSVVNHMVHGKTINSRALLMS